MSPLAFGMGKSKGANFDFAIFYSDKLQFYWEWTDGKDFDLRAEFIRPTQLAGVTVGHGKTSLITDGGGSQVYMKWGGDNNTDTCLLYTSPSPRDVEESRMPSSA